MPKKPKTQGAAHLGEGGPKAEARATTLVVVESPAKARSIQKMLGPGYEVRASKGHVADLPERSLGVDVERGFTPTYEVKKDKKPVVEELKRAAQGKRLLIATDPDREGEAIGWHVARLLGRDPKEPIRVEFHEITPKVVRQAVEAPRPIDQNLVDAQQARRVLDRLVGYNLSPLLSLEFRKRALSAGRVQSVALRLVVEREEEIEAFQEETYFLLLGRFLAEGKEVWASLYEVEGKRLFVGQGEKEGKLHIATEEEAQRLAQEARGLPYRVAQVETKERRKAPPPPFTTSTLQQAASSRLGYTASRTMRIAQRLYEGVDLPEGTVGLITYMRTDSVRVSPEALQAARAVIGEVFGPEYLPEAPRVYKNRKAGVQDAHEAIRPTDPRRTPESVRPYLSEEEYRLYDLIWRRFLASQMREALYEGTVVTFQDTGPNPRFLFRASGSVLKFEGYLKAWGWEGEEEAVEEPPVPALSQGARAELLEVRAEERHTEPPPRYTDATLVKTMEELGIGRPSTYAPTLETLEKRGYVARRGPHPPPHTPGPAGDPLPQGALPPGGGLRVHRPHGGPPGPGGGGQGPLAPGGPGVLRPLPEGAQPGAQEDLPQVWPPAGAQGEPLRPVPGVHGLPRVHLHRAPGAAGGRAHRGGLPQVRPPPPQEGGAVRELHRLLRLPGVRLHPGRRHPHGPHLPQVRGAGPRQAQQAGEALL
jgi:DNA topoisomerase-1